MIAPVCVSFRRPAGGEESHTALKICVSKARSHGFWAPVCPAGVSDYLESTQSEVPRSARNDSVGRVITQTPIGERVTRDRARASRRRLGLRPPKGSGRSGRAAGYGPQTGEGVRLGSVELEIV